MVRPAPENARDKDVDKLWKSGVNPVEIKLQAMRQPTVPKKKAAPKSGFFRTGQCAV
jgi:hypothetical protein